MVLLLPAAWLACLLLFRELAVRGRIPPDWRVSFTLAGATWGALLAGGTEILSLINSLNAVAVCCFWLAANAALWLALWRSRRQPPSDAGTGWTFPGLVKTLRTWPLDAQIILAAALLFAAFLGGIALFTPTTNWDSLTYHLPRVMHWIQNQSVAPYPTNVVAQIQMGPWSEFVQTHLWLLWGGDRFANLVQWTAFLGCVIVGTLLAGQLLPNASPAVLARTQAFAALLTVTLPTGIVESITTQTDLVTAFWLICLAGLALEWRRQPENRILATAFGAVLGLGVLTKFTFILFGLPVGLATAAVLLWNQRRALPRLVMPAILALAACLALALPHFARNRAVFGSVIGAKNYQAGMAIPHITVSGTLFNFLHNFELHSNTGLPSLTHQFNRAFHFLERGTGHSADEIDYSIPSSMYEAPDEFFVFDSFAASPWHVLLMCAALVVALILPRRNLPALMVLVLGLAGFVVLSIALRWQIWACRYHIPGLVLCLAPTAALLVPRLPRWILAPLSVGLLAFGLVIVANNRSRPIFDAVWRAEPRLEKLLSFQGIKYYGPMRAAAAQITAAGCQEIGLKLSPDVPEYPFWLMLREDGFTGQIHHQFVEGPSADLPGPAHRPDVIIAEPGSGRPVGDLAVQYPAYTVFSARNLDGTTNVVFTLYWSAKIAAEQTNNPHP